MKQQARDSSSWLGEVLDVATLLTPAAGQSPVFDGTKWVAGNPAGANVLRVSSYASLTAAVAAIGATPATLLLDAPTTCTANTTVPQTLALVSTRAGTVNQGANTLTINSALLGGLYQIFTGAGAVTFGPGTVDGVRPEWWGGLGDGVTDATAGVNAAITSVLNAAGATAAVLLASGNYLITAALTVVNCNGFSLKGQGKHVSRFTYAPTVDGTKFLTINPAAGLGDWTDLQGFSVFKTGTHYAYFFELHQLTSSRISDIQLNNVGSTDTASVGLYIFGRDNTDVIDVDIFVQQPIYVVGTGAGGVGLDHWSFRNIYLNNASLPSAGSYPLVKVNPGAAITNVSFEGGQAWVGGNGGFFWDSTGTAHAACENLVFRNVRWEDGALTGIGAPNPTFQITPNTTIHNVVFDNCYISSVSATGGPAQAAKHIYARKVDQLTIGSTYFDSKGNPNNAYCYDIDATCDRVFISGIHSTTASNLVSVGALIDLFAVGDSVSAPNYVKNNIRLLRANVADLTLDYQYCKIGSGGGKVWAFEGQVNATSQLLVPGYSGNVAMIMVAFHEGTGVGGGGQFMVSTVTANNAAVKVSGSANCVAGVPGAGNVGVYKTTGNTRITIDNQIAEARHFSVLVIYGP